MSKKIAGPKILLWDIENTHNVVAAFQLLNKHSMIPHENILQERFLVCASWMWLEEKTPHGVSILDDPERFAKNRADDTMVVKTLHDRMMEADVIVGHNGDEFDKKMLNARIIQLGLDPLPPVKQLDTLKTARNKFGFNSNRLDYLGRYLGVGRKIKTDNELWLEVLAGKPAAIKEMLKYNKQDVLLLKDVFLKLRPYMDNYVNLQGYGGDELACPRCGSTEVSEEGLHHADTQVYPKFHCSVCKGWYRSYKGHRSTKTRML